MTDQNARNAQALQSDRNLRGLKVVAALAVIVALLALTVTSVFRGPNDIWTIVIPAVAAVVAALLVRGLVRRRHRSSRLRPGTVSRGVTGGGRARGRRRADCADGSVRRHVVGGGRRVVREWPG